MVKPVGGILAMALETVVSEDRGGERQAVSMPENISLSGGREGDAEVPRRLAKRPPSQHGCVRGDGSKHQAFRRSESKGYVSGVGKQFSQGSAYTTRAKTRGTQNPCEKKKKKKAKCGSNSLR